MSETEGKNTDARVGEIGDVETAGETTAAGTVGGETADTQPVGADTSVKVADDERGGPA